MAVQVLIRESLSDPITLILIRKRILSLANQKHPLRRASSLISLTHSLTSSLSILTSVSRFSISSFQSLIHSFTDSSIFLIFPFRLPISSLAAIGFNSSIWPDSEVNGCSFIVTVSRYPPLLSIKFFEGLEFSKHSPILDPTKLSTIPSAVRHLESVKVSIPP